jgi:hypothetical protein
MRRIVLTFGLAAGAVFAAMFAITMPMYQRGTLDFDRGEVFGYTSMVLAFLCIYFGVRRYRDEVGGGHIGFGRALGVGLLITLVASGVYVASWEVLLRVYEVDFVGQYQAHLLARMRASGASEEALAAEQAKLAYFAELYAKPWARAAITLLEVFPLGFLVSMASAAMLRRSSLPPADGAGAPAAG